MTATTQVLDFLQPQDAIVDLAASSKQKVLQFVSERAAQALGLASSDVLHALLSREKLGSTGVGEGIALPHTRISGLAKPYGVLVRTAKPLNFDAIDEAPVDIVFGLVLPTENEKEPLNALACVTRRLRTPGVLQKMRESRTADEIYAAITGMGCS